MNRYEGDLVVKPGVVYEYEEITGNIYADGCDLRGAFAKLNTNGGGIDVRNAKNAWGAAMRVCWSVPITLSETPPTWRPEQWQN